MAMPKLLMYLMSVMLLGSKACNSNILGDFAKIFKSVDKTELYVIDAFPTPAQEQDLSKTYIADYKVMEYLPLSADEAASIKLAAVNIRNYDALNVKSCPFMAKYAVRFTTAKEQLTYIISPTPCGKTRLVFSANTRIKDKSMDLTPENGLEAAIQKVIEKSTVK